MIMAKDIFLPPPGKFSIVGYKLFTRCLFRRANNVPFAKNYAKRIARGEITFEALLISSHKDLEGIEVQDSSGKAVFCIGKPYGAFLMDS